MGTENIQVGNNIAFVYARNTKSGFKARAGKVTLVRPATVIIEETIAPGIVQHRQFYKGAMMNLEFHSMS